MLSCGQAGDTGSFHLKLEKKEEERQGGAGEERRGEEEKQERGKNILAKGIYIIPK